MTIKDKPSDALIYKFPHNVETVYDEGVSKFHLEHRGQWVISDEVEVKESDESNEGRKLVADRYVVRDYPKVFGNLFPRRQLMIHTETWVPDGAGGYKGSYTCDVQDAPVLVEGEMTLKPVGDGCELRTLTTVTAKMPIIGKRVEKYIIGQTRSQYWDQLHYLDMRIAGTRDLLPRDISKYPLPKNK